ncbi:bacillithiol biosynthesis cysteine-adding enzyme BshC [Ornithinibacillus halophilus]|uniref:Putative cysteine ligase BshC n=1 Tax=Ornithinibacillus halophilus TaxID=930117 RepID=A0A1M5C3W0_9BACI|nr:bacillithiol biosynthesis cysteine-adding enzyme BshC [Ornithinibacillus halophilus]SHF49297.1 bacillithiol biosynthesis cysteine-adding enzyme BshC [Ornithinibacillus halophilus]
MRIEPIKLDNRTKLMTDYCNNDEKIMSYFDYKKDAFGERLKEIQNREFSREQLANVLHQLNSSWDAPEETLHNINRLRDENAVVVVGGQQAGLLTGPLYSVNKVISIIQLAKQQEENLNVPVIPVFWIAGEDHDFDEINHIFLKENKSGRIKKYKTKDKMFGKQSVSSMEINKVLTSEWISSLFAELNETEYTVDLHKTLHNCLERSNTYVDFFARLIFELFQEEGLVLIDSDAELVRGLESDYFTQIIKKQPLISKGVNNSLQDLKQDGYTVSLEVESDDAHLFYHLDGERVLLKRKNEGVWVGKQNEVLFTTDELIDLAHTQPHLLSNNVVTRPLMQELLLPTLAFIGGPGEVGYWSVLKPAFTALNINMPPVVPRLSYTFVNRSVEKVLHKYNIPLERAIAIGVEKQKEKWLQEKNYPPIEEVSEHIKEEVERIHEPMRKIAADLRSDLGDLANKNLHFLKRDIEFLEKRIRKTIEEIYSYELQEFDLMNDVLHPLGGLQERVWNPIPLLNNYGMNVFKDVLSLPCSFGEDHYAVYL